MRRSGWLAIPSIASLRSRDYRLLWFATLPTSMGFWMEQVVLGWLVLDLSHSPFMVGIAGAARIAPGFFLGLVAGATADRLDRRRLLQGLLALQAAVSLLTGLFIVTERITVPLVILLAVASGSTSVFLFTARQAYIADVAGDRNLTNGIALNQVAQRLMGMPGALFGGGVVAWLGTASAYFFMAAGFAGALVLLLFLRVSSTLKFKHEASFWGNFANGLRLIKRNRNITVLLILGISTEIFAYSHITVLPVFSQQVLGGGPDELGALTAARSLGAFLGVVALSAFGNVPSKGKLLLACGAGFGISLIALGAAQSLPLALACLMVIGLASGCFDALLQATLQLSVGEGERGRAMGVWVLGLGVGPLGHVEAGALAQVRGAPTALALNGGLFVLIIVGLTFASARIRQL
ncbi:MAG: MFS transporter [Chloroflexi bacterium]|nr:MFS transporter [Chloroflexota bacterium]